MKSRWLAVKVERSAFMILLPVHSKNIGHRLVDGFPAGLREPPSTESTLESPLAGHQPPGQSESTFVDAPYSIHASMKNRNPPNSCPRYR